jgi:hypothetical protein
MDLCGVIVINYRYCVMDDPSSVIVPVSSPFAFDPTRGSLKWMSQIIRVEPIDSRIDIPFDVVKWAGAQSAPNFDMHSAMAKSGE